LSPSNETRARRKIRDIANRYEFVVEDIEWQPIGQMIEMQGREGGWTVWTDQGVITFFSMADALEAFELHRAVNPR
jgi:hypothetical protein